MGQRGLWFKKMLMILNEGNVLKTLDISYARKRDIKVNKP